MSKMRVAQISKAKEDFELVERDIPSPGPGQVRIKVQACGVCHSDLYDKEGLWPGLQFPGIPGHEVAGVINEVGSGISTWKKGDRAGWAGTAARTTFAPHAAREISPIVKPRRLPA
jgi:D-arabinose 1-dehydrogenase-like Zn-dependent alcohol dehydrogenase